MKTAAYKSMLGLAVLLSCTHALAGVAPKRGPQLRVAVAQFDANDRFKAEYGGWNIGGGLAAQLVTALTTSRRVIVVERAVLSKILMEQELSQNKLASTFTQVPAGQLLGVDFMIVGEVTEFEDKQIEAGTSFGLLKGWGPTASSDVTAAHVGIDMRIIDTRTGEVLCSHRAEGKAWGKSFGIKMKSGLIDFGGEVFYKTPLGKATRRAIESAMDFVLEVAEKQTADFYWLGRVIDVDGADVYIDAGRAANLFVGDRINISDVSKVLTDPESNAVLGLVEKEGGQAEVIQSELKYSKARIIGSFQPRRGGLVRFASSRKATSIGRKRDTGYKVMD